MPAVLDPFPLICSAVGIGKHTLTMLLVRFPLTFIPAGSGRKTAITIPAVFLPLPVIAAAVRIPANPPAMPFTVTLLTGIFTIIGFYFYCAHALQSLFSYSLIIGWNSVTN
jgi:hypothetical protein